MKILFVGDVVGTAGCEMLRNRLPALKKMYAIDNVIVNGENSAEGNGISPDSARYIFDSGADIITGGNHTFKRRDFYDELESNPFVLRPGNYPLNAAGSGLGIIDRGSYKTAVINLLGAMYIMPVDSPFEAANRLIAKARDEGCKTIIIDFHAEATAEKKALAFYLDGDVTAVIGTHTHVATADEQLLPRGTAYISDAGMCGPYVSVLGVKPEQSISLMKDKMPVRFETAPGECVLNGVIIEVDSLSGRAVSIERIEVR